MNNSILFLFYFLENLRDEIMNSGLTTIVKNLKEHKDEKVRESAGAVLTTIEEMPLER